MIRPPAASQDYWLRQGIFKLLAIKDSDVRLLSLDQCRHAPRRFFATPARTRAS